MGKKANLNHQLYHCSGEEVLIGALNHESLN